MLLSPADEDTVEYPMGVRQSATIVFSDNDDDVGDEKGRRKKRRKKGKVSSLVDLRYKIHATFLPS